MPQARSVTIDAGNKFLLPIDEFDLDQDGITSELLPYDFDGNPRAVDDPGIQGKGLIQQINDWAIAVKFKTFLIILIHRTDIVAIHTVGQTGIGIAGFGDQYRINLWAIPINIIADRSG